MKFKILVLLIVSLACSASFARKHHRRAPRPTGPIRYYFSVPVEASAEWDYKVPECQEIANEDYKLLQKNNCKPGNAKDAEICQSRADIELKNTATNEKKSFGLNYVVHKTKSACEDDREQLLSSTQKQVEK